MTDQEMLERLRSMTNREGVVGVGIVRLATDRIKELVERNKELTLQLLAMHGQAADAVDKLNKAVEALKKLDRRGDALETFDPVVHEIVTAALAELEGKG